MKCASLGVGVLASISLALAGCGGSSSPGVAHLATEKGAFSASSASGASPADSTATPQQAAIAFAKCMRANGVPSFPDPTADGNFAFHASAGMDRSSPLFKSAQAKCRKLIPEGPGSGPPPSPRTLARFLHIARCMRRHGVPNFPDPRTSAPRNPFGSGIAEMSDIEGVILLFPSTIDQQAPIFTWAAATCAFPLHNH